MTLREISKVHDTCGAKKRQGDGFCTQRAGWGTDHVGEGRCKLHGGATPVKHGRYSKTTRARLGSLIEGFRDDPTPWDPTDELLQMRALYVDYLRRAEEGKVELDHEAASRILDRVSKVIDRVERARSDSCITRPQFHRLMGEMGNVVAQNVASDDERRRIVDGWSQIRLT